MPELPKMEISHIGLYVTDMDKMRDFYTGLLGFTVVDAGEVAPEAVRFSAMKKALFAPTFPLPTMPTRFMFSPWMAAETGRYK